MLKNKDGVIKVITDNGLVLFISPWDTVSHAVLVSVYETVNIQTIDDMHPRSKKSCNYGLESDLAIMVGRWKRQLILTLQGKLVGKARQLDKEVQDSCKTNS